MPFDNPAAVQQPCPAPALYAQLREAADAIPGLVFACAGLIAGEPQRDHLLRAAFLTAIEHDQELAGRVLPGLLHKPWITDPGFFSILNFARQYPEAGRELLVLAARRYPGLALREELPGGAFEAAVLAAPDEAAGIAMGKSPNGQKMLERLRTNSSPCLQVIAKLADLGNTRAAIFSGEIAAGRMTMNQAVQASQEARYFSAVGTLRLAAGAAEIPALDRVLSTYAEVLFRTGGQAAGGLRARDAYLLLTYGRTEEDDVLFDSFFDRLLMPKMHSALELLNEVHDLNLRPFLATAAAHHRLEAFLGKVTGPAQQAQVLARAFTGLDSLEETIAADEIVDAIQDPARLRVVKDVVLTGKSGPFYGLLAAALARKFTDPQLQAAAQKYAPFFEEPRLLDAGAVFDSRGVCTEQYIFYDDDDAYESFESFRNTYAHDPRWNWEERGWYVHLTGEGAQGRRMEIFANVPRSVLPGGTENRRHDLSKLLAEQGHAPSILVHRGHTWYVAGTLEYVTNSARLVFLGSCRGLENSYSVMALANRAQLISTRGIGTTSINDALLRAINDELLSGAKSLDWERFWRIEESKLGSNPMFRDYIPPSRNTAAIMLAAYYESLASPIN